uniref:Branched-chain amino acid ABC transporter permease n=1 Tax=candidate division WOR-3 bacterium TaxID=2052148 RepID=A0A7C3YVG5_UNCW3
MSYFCQQLINGLQLGSVYALIALGYTMVYGIVRLINFAHGDIFMIGAYVGYFALAVYKIPFPLVFPLAMIICAFLGVAIEKLAYKPLRNAPRINLLITAMGVSLFLEYFSSLKFIFGPNFLAYPQPFRAKVISLGKVAVSSYTVLIFLIVFSLLLLLEIIIYRTKLGMAMRAVSYDKETASLMGIDVDRIISFTFALGSGLAAVGGILYGIAYPQIHPFMGIMPGLKAFVAAVLGGIGIIKGAVVGAFIMGILEILVSAYISSTWRDAIAFALLILFLLFKPSGIFGKEETEKV